MTGLAERFLLDSVIWVALSQYARQAVPPEHPAKQGLAKKVRDQAWLLRQSRAGLLLWRSCFPRVPFRGFWRLIACCCDRKVAQAVLSKFWPQCRPSDATTDAPSMAAATPPSCGAPTAPAACRRTCGIQGRQQMSTTHPNTLGPLMLCPCRLCLYELERPRT